MLWERDLLHLRYKYVELADEGGLGIGELVPAGEPHTIEPPRSGRSGPAGRAAARIDGLVS